MAGGCARTVPVPQIIDLLRVAHPEKAHGLKEFPEPFCIVGKCDRCSTNANRSALRGRNAIWINAERPAQNSLDYVRHLSPFSALSVQRRPRWNTLARARLSRKSLDESNSDADL